MRLERRPGETVLVLQTADHEAISGLQDRVAGLMGYSPREIELWDRNPDRRVAGRLDGLGRAVEAMILEPLEERLKELQDLPAGEILALYHAAKGREEESRRRQAAVRTLIARERMRELGPAQRNGRTLARRLSTHP